MSKIAGLKPERVFKYFEEISSIPRGSGNMEKISEYCVEFAKEHSLKAVRDDANNIVIYKSGSEGYENAEPVILQGHLDMVCQRAEDCDIDFTKDGLELYVDGDFVKARGTTLGADDGIAVAMIMAILESDTIEHPPVEAVFTTDEEIGMIGAGKFDMNLLSGKKMISLDSEDPSLTVSCAGGSDLKIIVPYEKKNSVGTEVSIAISGLKGGHSGVCIGMGRVNADVLMGRILNYISDKIDFDVVSLNGGDKGNAIPLACRAEIVTNKPEELIKLSEEYLAIIKEEVSAREPEFEYMVKKGEWEEYSVICDNIKESVIYALASTLNGVQEMSMEIEGLVETSLNLGILKTEDNAVVLQYALRSNKQSALDSLEDRLVAFGKLVGGVTTETFGHYPPWEYNDNSTLQTIYSEVYEEKHGEKPKICAIHAGLECGLFASAIDGIDCISIGPLMNGIHTVNEELSISSTEEIFDILKNVLKKL